MIGLFAEEVERHPSGAQESTVTVVEEQWMSGITGGLSTLFLSKAALFQSSFWTVVACENILYSAGALADG